MGDKLQRRGPGLAAAVLAAALASCRSPGPGVQGEVGASVPEGILVFEGNREISEGSLRGDLQPDIQRLRRQGFRKSDIDDLAFEAERIYRSRGYHFARVDYEHSPRRAVLRIQEGPRVFIGEIEFTGNRVFPPGMLLDLLRAKRAGLFGLGKRIFVEREAAALRGAVEEVYLDRGFQEVRVKEPRTEFTPDRTGARISIEIEEGPQYVVEKIDVSGIPLIEEKSLSERFADLTGSAYVPRLQFLVKSRVEDLYAERGYPEAKAAVSESAAPAGKDRVAVAFKVEASPGPAVRIRKVIIEGNERTRAGFISSRVLLKEGERDKASLRRQSFRSLFDTGLFKTIDLRLSPPDPEAPAGGIQERDLIVKVSERSSLEYFFELGFGSYDLARGRAGIREKNLFGSGLIGRAEVLGSIRGVQGTLGITDPWFLKTRWTADFPVTLLYREEPAFTIEEEKVGLRLSRPIAKGLLLGGAYRFSFSHVQNYEITDTSKEEPDLVLGALGPFLEYDSRNDLFAPSRGMRSRLFGEVGGPFFGGEISFFHGGLSLSRFLGILEGTVIAATMQTEFIAPLGNTDLIPIQERLFNGGENSVRSFKHSELGPKDPSGTPLGGEVRNLVSLELRQRVWRDFSLALFGDWGNVAVYTEDYFQDFRPAVGFGLRYALPIGPIRVDFAFNPDRREKDGEDLFVVQFAVGMPY